MSFLLYEQILVEFGVSKKVLASSGEHHEVINAIKTAFNIKEEIFLQKFDQDWQYIDFPEGKFENKARVKVILKPNKEVPDTQATATPSNTCTLSTTARNPLRQEAQVQATLLINNGKIQVGPKAKVCDISNYDQIKCLGSFYSTVRPMMMTNP
ncbi:uncharacterized protein [Montipora capricornis]|uniref:uncharacterized protein n=1 Tax=Montipora capricornis TaxID=246305 RepID=UPI0035F18B18